MDGFSFHPYPNEATDPLERGYAWPNAGFANLDRMKQALWDAFDGTAQPTTLDGLKLHLDEVGWQVDTAGRLGYRGRENVPVTDEIDQAAIYGQTHPRGRVRPRRRARSASSASATTACRTGFQAGLERADGSASARAAAVELAAASRRACAGELRVVGTRRSRPRRVGRGGRQGHASVTARVAAGEDARAQVLRAARRSLERRSRRTAAAPWPFTGCARSTSTPPRASLGRRGPRSRSRYSFAAESNRGGSTLVVAGGGRSGADLDIEHVFVS